MIKILEKYTAEIIILILLVFVLSSCQTVNEITMSYGKKYDNWFEKAHEANEWVYYIWEQEEWFNSTNSQELLYNAIQDCKRIDEENNINKIL